MASTDCRGLFYIIPYCRTAVWSQGHIHCLYGFILRHPLFVGVYSILFHIAVPLCGRRVAMPSVTRFSVGHTAWCTTGSAALSVSKAA